MSEKPATILGVVNVIAFVASSLFMLGLVGWTLAAGEPPFGL